MTDRTLYVIAISSDAQIRDKADNRKRVSAQGILKSSVGSVADIAAQPGEQALEVQFRDPLADEMTAELEEIAASGGIDSVPYYGTNTNTPVDGYYTIERVERTGRRAPQADQVSDFTGRITRAGRKASHFRSVGTAPQQVDHPFGNDDRALIGVPTTASELRWFDEEGGTAETATLVATRNAELGNVEVYDARAASFDDPTMVYNNDYSDQGPVDVRVWDTHGRSSRTDANSDLQWQKVFAASHDYDGEAILSNGLVRLRFDESTPSLTVEHWDDVNTTWSTTSLGTSDWEFYALDVTQIALADATATVGFRDTTQSPTAFFNLELHVKRGWNDALWVEPGTEGTPTGLDTLLDPVASGLIYDPAEDIGLTVKSEVPSA